jgi:hypothetical protein
MNPAKVPDPCGSGSTTMVFSQYCVKELRDLEIDSFASMNISICMHRFMDQDCGYYRSEPDPKSKGEHIAIFC